jgi:hypothetical protein
MSSRILLTALPIAIAACSAILGIEDTRIDDGSALVCPPARADCDDRIDNGCEADLSSAAACGSCAVQCGGTEPLCGPGGASYACTAQCDEPGQICGAACVDVTTSPIHCGRCGHDCGGGACVGGACQPVAVADALDQLDAPSALAANDAAIFWLERTSVRSCPLPLGCALAPTLIADTFAQLHDLAVTGDQIYFSGCRACDDQDHRLYECPVAGCPATNPPYAASSDLRFDGIIIGKTRVYW